MLPVGRNDPIDELGGLLPGRRGGASQALLSISEYTFSYIEIYILHRIESTIADKRITT
jgi:hypothetical protein